MNLPHETPIEKPGTRRLFFALWPDEATRARLAELLAALPEAGRHARDMRVENLHITLSFLGDCEGRLLPCLDEAGAAVRGEPFVMTFDQLGLFERARVQWAGVSQPPEALLRMQDALCRELEARCGLARDSRPFAPHLTLRRNARQSGEWPEDVAPIAWHVDAFVLVESINDGAGVHYQPIRQWAFSGECTPDLADREIK